MPYLYNSAVLTVGASVSLVVQSVVPGSKQYDLILDQRVIITEYSLFIPLATVPIQ